MAQHERQEIEFLDDEGGALTPEELDAVDGSERAYRRRARVEQYLPEGGGAAIAALVFVLVTWLGANPLVQAAATVFPQSSHTIGGDPSDPSGFSTQYYGVTPGLVPVISFGVRALVAVLALVLALRARHREHSPLATAAVATASLTLLLMVVAGVVMVIGLGVSHGAGNYGTPF